ncbi:MAG: alpha/beta fold hydrolase [Rhodothalassiaceae bacterium]
MRWHRAAIPAPFSGAPCLVWLHGWGQSGASLLPLARLLAPRAAGIVFDLPGFGRTPPLAPDAGTADYADALAGEIDGVEPVVLVGHSFGARVALQFAARHPTRVAALVLIAGAGLKRRRSLFWRLRAAALKALGRLARGLDRVFGSDLHDRYARRFGSADYRRAGALRGTFLRAVNEDLSAIARDVTVPTLLIYGSGDRETPPEIGSRLAALIPRAELHLLEGFGHLDILGRGAYQCEHLIARFLERHV